MHRRQFLGSFATLAIAAPVTTLPALAAAPAAESLVLSDKILALEAQWRAQPGVFNLYLHNELRHEYLAISERMSRMHADIILRHSTMDNYTLNTLSDWHLTDWWGQREPQKAVEVLLSNAERYSEFDFVRAACLTRAAEALQELGLTAQANKLFGMVATMGLDRFGDAPSLDMYRARARAKMRA